MERRVGSLVVAALLLSIPLAAGEGNRYHEDPATASDDYALIRALADRFLSVTSLGLDAAVRDEPHEAGGWLNESLDRAAAMEGGATVAAGASTSSSRLKPIASGAGTLAESASAMGEDWARYRDATRDGVDQAAVYATARLLLAAMRGHVERATSGAEAFAALDFDVGRLSDALAEFRSAIDREAARLDAERPEGPDALLVLEVETPRLPLGQPLFLRGLVATRASTAGASVEFEADGRPWGKATADEHGFFRFVRAVPLDFGLGDHVVRARALDLVSNDAGFFVTKIPTFLALAPSRSVFPFGNAPEFVIGLSDLGGPIAGTVELLNGTVHLASVEVVDGTASFTWTESSLPQGEHALTARFAGTDTHLASATETPFRIGPALKGVEKVESADASWLLATVVPLLGHVALLASHARRGGRRLKVLLFAGPFGAGALAAFFAGEASGGLALVLSAGASFAFHRRHAPPRPQDAVPATARPRPGGPDLRPSASTSAAPSSRAAIVAAYRRVLSDLVVSGIETGPRTHREIEAILLDRGFDAAAVREVTRLAERALYEGYAADEDVPAFSRAAAALGGSAA